jgi:hypothetical protein
MYDNQRVTSVVILLWYNPYMNSESRNSQNYKEDFIIEPNNFSFYEKMNVFYLLFYIYDLQGGISNKGELSK